MTPSSAVHYLTSSHSNDTSLQWMPRCTEQPSQMCFLHSNGLPTPQRKSRNHKAGDGLEDQCQSCLGRGPDFIIFRKESRSKSTEKRKWGQLEGINENQCRQWGPEHIGHPLLYLLEESTEANISYLGTKVKAASCSRSSSKATWLTATGSLLITYNSALPLLSIS